MDIKVIGLKPFEAATLKALLGLDMEAIGLSAPQIRALAAVRRKLESEPAK